MPKGGRGWLRVKWELCHTHSAILIDICFLAKDWQDRIPFYIMSGYCCAQVLHHFSSVCIIQRHFRHFVCPQANPQAHPTPSYFNSSYLTNSQLIFRVRVRRTRRQTNEIAKRMDEWEWTKRDSTWYPRQRVTPDFIGTCSNWQIMSPTQSLPQSPMWWGIPLNSSTLIPTNRWIRWRVLKLCKVLKFPWFASCSIKLLFPVCLVSCVWYFGPTFTIYGLPYPPF